MKRCRRAARQDSFGRLNGRLPIEAVHRGWHLRPSACNIEGTACGHAVGLSQAAIRTDRGQAPTGRQRMRPAKGGHWPIDSLATLRLSNIRLHSQMIAREEVMKPRK